MLLYDIFFVWKTLLHSGWYWESAFKMLAIGLLLLSTLVKVLGSMVNRTLLPVTSQARLISTSLFTIVLYQSTITLMQWTVELARKFGTWILKTAITLGKPLYTAPCLTRCMTRIQWVQFWTLHVACLKSGNLYHIPWRKSRDVFIIKIKIVKNLRFFRNWEHIIN